MMASIPRSFLCKQESLRACFRSSYTKITTTQRGREWPLHKDYVHICKAFSSFTYKNLKQPLKQANNSKNPKSNMAVLLAVPALVGVDSRTPGAL